MTKNFDPAIGESTQWKKGQPSPNPGGRPRTAVLSRAIGAKLAELVPNDPKGRTYAELIADNLVNVATGRGKGVVAAVMQIADRTEGRPFQSIGVADITRDVRDRSDEDLHFYLDHGCWPEDRHLLGRRDDEAKGR